MQLLEFARFSSASPPSGAPDLSDRDIEGAWQRMQPHLVGDGYADPLAGEEEAPELVIPAAAQAMPPAVAQIPSPRAEVQPYRSYGVPHMLAAASLAAALGLSLWGTWLHQELQAARRPEIIETVPLQGQPEQAEGRLERGVHRGVVRGPQRIEELSTDRSHVLELHLPPHKPFSRFRFEILRADGSEPLLSDDTANAKPDLNGGSSMTLRLPRKSLPPGTYTFRVSGLDGGSLEPVASYSVKITP